MTAEEISAFLDEQMVMQCATNGPRGLPHMVPLWFVPELRSWTYAKSQKAKNLERDPRATLGIEDGVQYHELRGVMFECDVRVERDPSEVEKFGLELFARYAGDLTDEIRAMVARPGAEARGTDLPPHSHSQLGPP